MSKQIDPGWSRTRTDRGFAAQSLVSPTLNQLLVLCQKKKKRKSRKLMTNKN